MAISWGQNQCRAPLRQETALAKRPTPFRRLPLAAHPYIGKFAKTWSIGMFAKELLWSAWWHHTQGRQDEAEVAIEEVIQIIVKEKVSGEASKSKGKPQDKASSDAACG